MYTGLIWLCAGTAAAAALHVTVAGIRNDRGKVEMCVFDTDEGFPDCSGLSGVVAQSAPAAAGVMRFDLDVPPGAHAVSVLHDENGNGRMDTNFFGIPTEGGGVSNNPKPRMGPPRYSEAVFTLPPEGADIVVNMVYP